MLQNVNFGTTCYYGRHKNLIQLASSLAFSFPLTDLFRLTNLAPDATIKTGIEASALPQGAIVLSSGSINQLHYRPLIAHMFQGIVFPSKFFLLP
jgi:hypothetical protein